MARTVKIAVAAPISRGRTWPRTLDHRIGGQSAAVLMERMIIKSDNPSTDLCCETLAGRSHPDMAGKQQNIEHRIDRTIAQLLRAKRDLGRSRFCNALAMVQLLQRLPTGNCSSRKGRPSVRTDARCTRVRPNEGALAWGTPVEHKTGRSTAAGDVGFITMQDGRRIAVAFFARAVSTGRARSPMRRAVYDGF